MAANKNVVGYTANDGTWAEDGPKIIPEYVRDASGEQQVVMPRAFGQKTATNGADTGSAMGHRAVAETYDDAWDVANGTATTSAARADNLRGQGAAVSVIAGRKAIFIRNKSSSVSIFYSHNSSVTASSTNIGAELLPGAGIHLPFGENMTLYVITPSSTAAYELFQFA